MHFFQHERNLPSTEAVRPAGQFDLRGKTGSAGSGKSFALTLDPLRHCQGPYAQKSFRGAIFRRTYPQISSPGGLLDECRNNYEKLGAVYNHTSAQWRFPIGAKLNLSSLQFNKDLQNYQGAQLSFAGFDEISQFEQSQVMFLWGRVRSVSGISGTLRGTCNPDADSWLYRFLHWWIDPVSGYPIKERSGVIRYFKTHGEEFIWSDDPTYDEDGVLETTSATFIPATLDDNQALMQADPTYRQRLMQLSDQERDRYLHGNWLASSVTGTEWGRDLFIDVKIPYDRYPVPKHANDIVRMFAIDGSKGKHQHKGDYSSIVCIAQTPELKYIDADIKRRPPGQIVEDVFQFTNQDHHRIRSGDLIGIEALQFQEIFINLIMQYAADHPDYALSKYLRSGGIIIPVMDNLKKEMRIRRLDGPLRRREFRFLDNPDTMLLVSQLRNWDGIPGVNKHDDGPDSLDMAQQLPGHLERYYEELRKKK